MESNFGSEIIEKTKTGKLEPQLVLIINNEQEIEKLYIFSSNKNYKNSNVYSNYLLIKEQLTDKEIPEYMIEKHIFLTLTIKQLRSFLIKELNIGTFILYSYLFNIDYKYIDSNIIFDPFNTIVDDYIKNDNILYNLYDNIIDNCIICLLKTNDNFKKHSSDIDEKSSIGFYSHKILKNIENNNYELSTSEYIIEETITDLSQTDVLNILYNKKISNIEIQYNEITDNYYILGTNKYLELLNIENTIILDLKKYFRITKAKNFFIKYYDKENYKKFIKDNKDISLKIINNDYQIYYRIDFNTVIKTNLNLKTDFDYFIIHTTTENIYKDISKKIFIFLSLSHTNIRFKNEKKIKLAEYLTLIILGYNNIERPFKIKTIQKKKDNLYLSRFCQNTKKSKRKVIKTDIISKNTEKISDIFYRGKVIDGKKTFDFFINEDSEIITCEDPNYPNINFLNTFFKYDKTCTPCCYSSIKETPVFNYCIQKIDNTNITNKNENNKNIIHNYGRLVLNNKLSLLPNNISKILNKESNIEIDKKKNVIISATNYHVITSFSSDVIFKNDNLDKYESSILNYIMLNKCIILDLKKIYININAPVSNDIFMIIQNRLHKIITIDKDIGNDIIRSNNININLLLNIFDTNSIFKKFKFEKTKHLYFIPKINFENNFKSTIILNYFNNYLKNVITVNINIFNTTFVLNILNILNEQDAILLDIESKNKFIHKLKQIENLLIF